MVLCAVRPRKQRGCQRPQRCRMKQHPLKAPCPGCSRHGPDEEQPNRFIIYQCVQLQTVLFSGMLSTISVPPLTLTDPMDTRVG